MKLNGRETLILLAIMGILIFVFAHTLFPQVMQTVNGIGQSITASNSMVVS